MELRSETSTWPVGGSSTAATSTAPRVRADTVEALVEQMRVLAHDEEARGASLKQRGGLLVGFAGVVLGIVLTEARVIASGEWGEVGSPVGGLCVLAAVLMLAACIRKALGVLSVADLWHFGRKDVARYGRFPCLSTPRETVQGTILLGWIHQFTDEREANDDKADDLQSSFRWFFRAAIIVAASTLILILVLRALGV